MVSHVFGCMGLKDGILEMPDAPEAVLEEPKMPFSIVDFTERILLEEKELQARRGSLKQVGGEHVGQAALAVDDERCEAEPSELLEGLWLQMVDLRADWIIRL